MQPDDEALLMRLTARGPLPPSSEPFTEGVALPTSIDDGFKLGHDAIVDSFFRLTPENAHMLWERKI
jgi:hypothetical protein